MLRRAERGCAEHFGRPIAVLHNGGEADLSVSPVPPHFGILEFLASLAECIGDLSLIEKASHGFRAAAVLG